MWGRGHVLLVATLLGTFLAGVSSEPIFSLVQRKLQPVMQVLEMDCLKELIAVRDSKGGLADGLDEAKIFLAIGRGHPADLFRSGNKKLVKAVMKDPAMRVTFGETPAQPINQANPCSSSHPQTPPALIASDAHAPLLLWGEDRNQSRSATLSRHWHWHSPWHCAGCLSMSFSLSPFPLPFPLLSLSLSLWRKHT